MRTKLLIGVAVAMVTLASAPAFAQNVERDIQAAGRISYPEPDNSFPSGAAPVRPATTNCLVRETRGGVEHIFEAAVVFFA